MLQYTKSKKVWLKGHTEYTEKWVQQQIVDDPEILGLGSNLIVRDEERIQQNAGRLDLLLQDSVTRRRYELELQLGASDPSHIIRTIEYWDIERKHLTQYDHCAVLVAEDITSRFLNVVSLFNGTIPLIAVQMQALEVDGKLTLSFIKVMDEMPRGEEAAAPPTDRAYWEGYAGREIVGIADEALKIIHEFAPSLQLNYTKYYTGLAQNGRVNNFISFVPKKQKQRMILQIKLKESEDINAKINDIKLGTWNYGYGYYHLSLNKNDLCSHREKLKELMEMSFKDYGWS